MIRLALVALLLCATVVAGCRGRQPATISSGKLKTTYSIEDLELQGPTEGKSTRWRFLFFPFGEPKSFLDAEREALARTNSDILIDRVRYTGMEGVLLPLGEILSWFVPELPDFDVPIAVRETWYVGGVGATFRDPRRRAPRR